MPTYEYRCKDCGHEFDITQAFTDDALTVCPECAGALKKKFGSVGIAFKGSGFYKNDSRGSKASLTTSGADATSDTSSGDTAKSGDGSKSSDTSSTSTTSSDSSSTTSSSSSGGDSSSPSTTTKPKAPATKAPKTGGTSPKQAASA